MAFTAGISYTFGNETLAPGQVGVLVHNLAAFTDGYYGDTSNIDILGSYQSSGDSFSNKGEEVTLVDAAGNTLEDFTYRPTWFLSTAGKGATLEVVDPGSNPDLNLAASWRASPEIDGTPGVDDSVPTAAPAGLAATPGSGQITLNWSAVAGAASYNVYMGTSAGGESLTPIATGVVGTTFISQGLTGGVQYFYYVTAVDPGGESGQSNEASATPTAAVFVVPPGFTPGDIIVYRVGDSTSPAGTSAATPVFLDEYTPTGTLVQSTALPSTNATGLALTDSGKASSGGLLSLSPDGSQIALFGYDVNSGTAGATGSATETIGIVGPSGTPLLEAFTDQTTSNARSAAYDPATGKLYTSGGVGGHQLRGDANYSAAVSSPVTFVISQVMPTVTLASPPGSIVYDGTTDVASWVQATVAGVAGVPDPTGSPTFTYYTGTTTTGTPLGSSPINAGTYTVVANYGGDSNYVGSTSNSTTFTITKAGTSVTLSSPQGSIIYDAKTDVTSWVKATVTGLSRAAAPTGSVTYAYYAGTKATGAPLGFSPVNPGTYTVVANYAGDVNYAPATSSPVTFTVGKATAKITIAAPPATITYDGTTDVTGWVQATVGK